MVSRALKRRSANMYQFLVYKHKKQSPVKGLRERSKGDNDTSSNSLFSIDPYNNAPNTSLQCASSELNEMSIDEVSEPTL